MSWASPLTSPDACGESYLFYGVCDNIAQIWTCGYMMIANTHAGSGSSGIRTTAGIHR